MQKSTLDQWVSNPVTQVLIRVLKQQHDQLSTYLIDGGLSHKDPAQLAIEYNRVVGHLQSINGILTYDIIRDESLDGDEDEDNTKAD